MMERGACYWWVGLFVCTMGEVLFMHRTDTLYSLTLILILIPGSGFRLFYLVLGFVLFVTSSKSRRKQKSQEHLQRQRPTR